MKFDMAHIAFLAGLVEEDDIEETRNKLAEGLMIERRDFDMQEVSDRVTLLDSDIPEVHADKGVLREGVMDGTWDHRTIVEYLGFDPSDGDDYDDEHPEHPELPQGYEYSTHATPGYESDPTSDPGERMEDLRGRQEKNHWKNQLNVRGPGAQAMTVEDEVNEWGRKMKTLVESCTVSEEKMQEDEDLRDTVLRRWAINESADESVTMGFTGIGFGNGPRSNAAYSGFGGSFDSGDMISPGYTHWDKQISECGEEMPTDMGYEEDEMLTDDPAITVDAAVEMPVVTDDMPAAVPDNKITGFEDDPGAESTIGPGHQGTLGGGGDSELVSALRRALGL